jgi:hypothetical protein
MMIGPEKARAYFLKARAEAALGLMTQAREDGKTAAAECFDHARIVLRDEVEDWLKTLSDGHS